MRVQLIAIAEDVGDLVGLSAGAYVLLPDHAQPGWYRHGTWDGKRFKERGLRANAQKALSDCYKRAPLIEQC